MPNKKLKGADYLLLLLFLDQKQPVLGAVRLEKMMFLFNQEISKALKQKGLESEKLPKFTAYNFGPFSKDVYEQAEFFKGIGFIKIININAQEELGEVDDWEESSFVDELWNDESGTSIPDSKYMKYEITDKGSEFVSKLLLKEVNVEQLELLEIFKKKITNTPIKQLLHYVYVNYPEFTKNSLIKGEVLGNE